MRYKLLGRSGLRVAEVCLGTMTFGEDWGWGASKEDCRQMVELYCEAGGNFIDTANYYTEGTAERLVGEFIAGERDRWVVSTKYTLFKRQGDPNASGNHRKNLVQSLEASLKQLRTDYIDIYWIHAWDQITPIEEVMRALDDVVRAGKVLYVGASDTPAWVIAQANTLADWRGWSRFIGLQAPYNLLERELEADMLPMARALEIGVLAWGPLSSGKLSGKHREGQTPDTKRMRHTTLTDRESAIVETVIGVAEEIGCSPAQVAINWIRAQQHRAQIIPIIGARTLDQFRDNLACLGVSLTPDQVQRLDAASAIELWFPHDFLAADTPKKLIYGGTYDQIDLP